MNKTPRPITRAMATLLAVVLVQVSFGPQAWSAVIRSVPGTPAPVGGAAVPAQTAGKAGIAPLAPAAVPAIDLQTSSIYSARGASLGFDNVPQFGHAFPELLEESAARVPAEKPPLSLPIGEQAPTVSRKTWASTALDWIFEGRKEKAGEVIVPTPSETPSRSHPVSAEIPEFAPLSAGESRAATAAPPTPTSVPTKAGGWFGLGKAAAFLIAARVTMQVGLEAQGSAMAQLIEKAFRDFSILAQVSIVAQVGMVAGQQLSQLLIKKVGLAKSFYLAHSLRAASVGAMILLLGTGNMPLALMFVFYAINGVMSGIANTTEGTIRKLLVGTGEGRMEKFRTWDHLLAEIVGTIAPIAFGALVPVIGPSLVTAFYPATIVMALLLLIAKKTLPNDAAVKIAALTAPIEWDTPPPAGPRAGPWTRFVAALKSIWAAMIEGKNIVWRNPNLRYAFLCSMPLDLMNIFLYRLGAPGYAKLVVGSGNIAPIQGMIVGNYSFGGLIVAAGMILAPLLAKRRGASTHTRSDDEARRRSMLRWTFWSAPALLLAATMAIPPAWITLPAFFVAHAVTLPALAMIPLGIVTVCANIKLNSHLVDNLPSDKDQIHKALVFESSVTTVTSIASMIILKPFFGSLSTFNPFPLVSLGLVPFAALILFSQRRLAATPPLKIGPKA